MHYGEEAKGSDNTHEAGLYHARIKFMQLSAYHVVHPRRGCITSSAWNDGRRLSAGTFLPPAGFVPMPDAPDRIAKQNLQDQKHLTLLYRIRPMGRSLYYEKCLLMSCFTHGPSRPFSTNAFRSSTKHAKLTAISISHHAALAQTAEAASAPCMAMHQGSKGC